MLTLFFILLIIHSPLFSMELSDNPSNSTLEALFFIKNINHTNNQNLPQDILKKLSSTYIDFYKDEIIFAQTEKCQNLVNVTDYMNLNESNKNIIKKLIKNNLLNSVVINNNKYFLIDPSQKNAPEIYAEVSQLPLNIKNKIADKYGSIVLVKEKPISPESPWLNKKDVLEKRLENFAIVTAPTGSLGTCIYCGLFPHWSLESIIMINIAVGATGLLYYHLYNALYPVKKGLQLYKLNGYKELPLIQKK